MVADRVIFVSSMRYSLKMVRNNWLLEVLKLQDRKELDK